MPKNNKKYNAFFYFMLDWKRKEEKRGRQFPSGIKDVQTDPDCNNEWKNLSEQEKERYKTMVKTNKAEVIVTKRTGLGESVLDIQRAQNQKETFKDIMSQYIHNLIEEAKMKNQIPKLEFYVVHVNYYFTRTLENNEIDFYPAEIAIAEFSLENGITRVYNQIVNEKIMLGYTGEAKEHSMNTHHIPPNPPFGKSDYKEIFRDICKFIEPGKKNGKLPPLYTMFSMEEYYHPVKSVISRLAIAAEKCDDHILVYSFEELFTNIQNVIKEQSEFTYEPLIAKLELLKDPYDYKSGLECEYHEKINSGIRHCSQHIVKRWVYQLCVSCCKPLDIIMVEGCHKPKESNRTNDRFGIASLNSTLSCLSLNESRRAASVLSMTGVNPDYRMKVSERSYREEQLRRAEADLKPIEIIDHSKLNSELKKPHEPIERPLRRPFTKNVNHYADSTETESIDFSENSFPSVGRGQAIKKKKDKSVGLSYASRLKS